MDEPTEYDGFFTLNTALVSKLHNFLVQKEAELADYLLHAFLPMPGKLTTPLLPTHTADFKLSQIIEPLEKTARNLCESQPVTERKANWPDLKSGINQHFWKYVETLEGISIELHDELSQVGFDHWRTELFDIVKSINEDLLRRVEDLRTTLKKTEHFLWEFRTWKQSTPSVRNLLNRLQLWFTDTLDAGLRTNLDKTEQFLRTKFKDFSDRFDAYCKIDPMVSQALDKIGNFVIIKKLDRTHQDSIALLSILLLCWETAKKSYRHLTNDISRSLFHSININQVPGMLRDHYLALRGALFEMSRAFKVDNVQDLKPTLAEGIAAVRQEGQWLKGTANSYRDFIHATAPSQVDEILKVIYDLQHLDGLWASLNQSLINVGDPEQKPYKFSLRKEVEGDLHAMGQPLISRKQMRSQVHQLLPRLQDCDELGSTHETIVDFVGETLGKALKLDGKYQVLQEFPSFHDLIYHHFGIVGTVDERPHVNRIGKFKRIIQHIEQWVKGGKTYRHIDEIEVDMNDIKEYLQDFLATLQRLARESVASQDKTFLNERIQKFSKMLLEYRYLFSNFFFFLRQQGQEGEYIRNQFHYVERYFEAAEHQLQLLRNSQDRVDSQG